MNKKIIELSQLLFVETSFFLENNMKNKYTIEEVINMTLSVYITALFESLEYVSSSAGKETMNDVLKLKKSVITSLSSHQRIKVSEIPYTD